jgi:sugar transferase (PEP-CTERM/EpsH1 system associated)
MEPLLFLAHRVPYPPNKGDKIRSYRLLKHLAARYRVFLGSFVDDPEDWRHQPVLEGLCEEVCLVGMAPRWRRMRSLAGLLRREPLSLAYYRSRRLREWIAGVVRDQRPNRALVFSSPMAQYLRGEDFASLTRVADFVDVDSEKWRQYSERHAGPKRWIYRREARTLLDFERAVAAEFDACLFVTREEAALFRRLAPEVAGRVSFLNNGVDTLYFSPEQPFHNPYAPGAKVVAFTGAMDYWANADAVEWFARDIFPQVRDAIPGARFYVVGARPTPAVQRLGAVAGVSVTGAVADVRPYLAHAAAAVAPLRIARGVQNKVLEALAMGRPVAMTRAAAEGLSLPPSLSEYIADDGPGLARCVVRLLQADPIELARLGAEARQELRLHYDWSVHLGKLDGYLEASAVSSSTPVLAEAAR